MKTLLRTLQLSIFLTFSVTAFATFLPVSDQQRAASCYEGSPMLQSDVCWGQVFRPSYVVQRPGYQMNNQRYPYSDQLRYPYYPDYNQTNLMNSLYRNQFYNPYYPQVQVMNDSRNYNPKRDFIYNDGNMGCFPNHNIQIQ